MISDSVKPNTALPTVIILLFLLDLSLIVRIHELEGRWLLYTYYHSPCDFGYMAGVLFEKLLQGLSLQFILILYLTFLEKEADLGRSL